MAALLKCNDFDFYNILHILTNFEYFMLKVKISLNLFL